VFNAFVDPWARTGGVENPPPLEDLEAEERESLRGERTVRATTDNEVPNAASKLKEK
jgi:hypothetical protein